jgi:polysaccharide biosynthesis/export protein
MFAMNCCLLRQERRVARRTVCIGLWLAVSVLGFVPGSTACQGSFAWPNGGTAASDGSTGGWITPEQMSSVGNHDGFGLPGGVLPARPMLGVNGNSARGLSREPRWNDQQMVPWESQAYGEYLGPYRTPHVPEYRLRVGDVLDFVYLLTRRSAGHPYKFHPGDTISITAVGDPSLNQPTLTVLSDGTITLPLIGNVVVAGKTSERLIEELNDRFKTEGKVRDPRMVVQVIKGDTPLNDLRDSVDARQGQGGQSRQVEVSPDGTIQLPLLGPVPAIGLSLEEMAREVNARYAMRLDGISVNPILVRRAPRAFHILGQVNRPGRIEMTGPTTVMQAIAQAEGWRTGSNLRQIIVFRRDENWNLVATKIDLQGALNGRRPHPSDEIWLRDSDIVLVPKAPIQRFSEAVDLYLVQTLYSIFPQQGIVFNFDGFTTF